MDDDQEILKGTLKAKTVELDAKIEELKDVISRYTLIIKATVPQERWVDFGITAKK